MSIVSQFKNIVSLLMLRPLDGSFFHSEDKPESFPSVSKLYSSCFLVLLLLFLWLHLALSLTHYVLATLPFLKVYRHARQTLT